MSNLSSGRTLSGLLQDSNTENWSARRIAQEAHKRGIAVSYTSIAKYLRNVPLPPPSPCWKPFQLC